MHNNPRAIPIQGIEPGGHLDAFGRLRISDLSTLFGSKFLHDKLPILWDEATTDTSGNAASTHSTANAAITLHVETDDEIIRQTFQRFGYQEGKSQLSIFTGILGSGGTGVTARIGLNDGSDGLYFQISGTTVSVGILKGGSTTPIVQSVWNVDTLDGTNNSSNPSGITFNSTKTQIFVVDFQWLGVGTVRFGFFIGGEFVLVHQIHNANIATTVYMATPNLPIRYEIASTSATAEMVQICCTVMSEGGQQLTEATRGASTGGAHVDCDVVDTIYPIIAIRLKTTHLDAIVKPIELSIMSETNSDLRYIFSRNPTISGTALDWNDVTDSALQVALGVTATTIANNAALGTILQEGYVSSKLNSIVEEVKSKLIPGASVAGTADIFCLSASPVKTGNDDVHGSLTWNE